MIPRSLRTITDRFGGNNVEGYSPDWHFARDLGRRDGDHDFIRNGTVVKNAEPLRFVEFGCDVIPSEIGLSTRQTASAFDPTLKIGHEEEGPMLVKSGFRFDIANPERYYDDGRIKITGHLFGSGSEIHDRRGYTAVEKGYAWLRGVYIHNRGGDSGFDFDYTAIMQTDGVDVDVPIVEDGSDGADVPKQLVSELLQEKLDGYDVVSDGCVHAEEFSFEVTDETVQYELAGSGGKGTYLIPSPVEDIVQSGLIRPTEITLYRESDEAWRAEFEFEYWADIAPTQAE